MKYELYYWPGIQGRGEFIRLALEEAGADGLVLFNRLFEPEIDVEALEVKRVLHLSDSSELPLRLRWLAILSRQVDEKVEA